VGRELGDVPPVFGWELVLFKPNVEPTMSEGVSKPYVVQPGPEPVSEQSEARTRSRHIFLDRLDDPFINLDRVEDLKEGDNVGSVPPIKIVQPKPIKCPKPSEWDPDVLISTRSQPCSQTQNTLFWIFLYSLSAHRNDSTTAFKTGHQTLHQILQKILPKNPQNS